MAEEQQFTIESIRREVPGIVKYLEEHHGNLAVKHIKGNPADRQIGIAVCGCENSEHAYLILSDGKPLGEYSFCVELLDGDITDRRFKFCDNGIELIWNPSNGREDNYRDIPFP